MRSRSHFKRREMSTRNGKLDSNLLLLLAFGGATLLAGCAQGMDQIPPSGAVQPIAMTVTVCDSGEQGCSPATSFSLGTFRDLGVGVDWKNVPGGTHTQQIALVQPNGVVYQTVSHSFGVADGKNRGPPINDVIPAAGTVIPQRSQIVEWNDALWLHCQAIGMQKIQFLELTETF